MHDAGRHTARCPADKQVSARGIEVGHIFYFGTKYSEPMKAVVAGPDGKERAAPRRLLRHRPSRLVAAIIEACHDEAGIIWPEPVAPFDVIILNLKQGDAATDAACEQLYRELSAKGLDVLYHDPDERPGAKFATADLIGIPWQILVGPEGAGGRPGGAEAPRRRQPHHARPGRRGGTALRLICSLLERRAVDGLKRPESDEMPDVGRILMAEPAGTRPFAPFEWMVSLRYLRARRKEGFISVIAGFSFLGIMLGVATLIIVMAVMNGFRKELLDKILGLNGHLLVQPLEQPLTDWEVVAERLSRCRACGSRRPSWKARRWPPRRSIPPACWCAASARGPDQAHLDRQQHQAGHA